MRWTHIIFSIIWFVTACVFGYLSHQSFQSQKIVLIRFTSTIPESPGTMYYNKVNLTMFFNNMVETNNRNIDKLESSMRHSAKTSFVLNLISCIAAIFGFLAQGFEYFYCQRK